jgi:hypothetical protein
MKSKTLTSAARVLSLLLLVSATSALAQQGGLTPEHKPVHFSGLLNDYVQSAHCVLVRSSLRPMLQGQLRLRVRSVLSRLLLP